MNIYGNTLPLRDEKGKERKLDVWHEYKNDNYLLNKNKKGLKKLNLKEEETISPWAPGQ